MSVLVMYGLRCIGRDTSEGYMIYLCSIKWTTAAYKTESSSSLKNH